MLIYEKYINIFQLSHFERIINQQYFGKHKLIKFGYES